MPRFFWRMMFLLACGLMGCSGSAYDVLPVTGEVTLNGKPVPEARVAFLPSEGRPAIGKTDQDGRYQLSYTFDVKGTPPGEYRVQISTAVEQDDGSLTKELVPAKYNTQSELTAEVTPEKNVFDFNLTD